MIPCPSKLMLGISCPGCGLQRSILAMLEGDWEKSFQLYPALFPLMLTYSIVGLNFFIRIKGIARILLFLYILDTTLIFGPFILRFLF